MDRKYHSRISKFEELLLAEQKRREEERRKRHERRCYDARLHAIAVAAIVLSGQPSPIEPLAHAWARTLQAYGIQEVTRDLVTKIPKSPIEIQHAAARQLWAKITQGPLETFFTEVFRTAPVWLMRFAGVFFDSMHLNFTIPQGGDGVKWGHLGYEASRKWPLIPSGRIIDGRPLSDEEALLWPFSLGMIARPDPIPKTEDSASEEDDDGSPTGHDFREFFELLDLLDVRELSRYEHIRFQQLFTRLSY